MNHGSTISIAITIVANTTVWVGSVFNLIRIIIKKELGESSSHELVFTKSLVSRNYAKEKSQGREGEDSHFARISK